MAYSLSSLLRRNRWKCLVLLAILCSAAIVLTLGFGRLGEFDELDRFARRRGQGNVTTVLFWNRCFDKKRSESYSMEQGLRSCGKDGLQCLFTDDRGAYPRADAIVFHAASDHPADIPDLSLRPPSQIWVFHNMEIDYNQTYARDPRLPGLFNWTHTFLSASDVNFPYGKVTRDDEVGYLGGFDSNRNYLDGRTKSVVALISDCAYGRMNLVRKLSRYIDVVVYGRWGIRGCPRGTNKCWNIVKSFKFYLAFEDHICKDYVTEKFYNNALRHGIVPVVLGGANYSNPPVAPPHSYINAIDFSSVAELARYLHHVGNSPELYNAYFQWRSQYSVHFHLDKGKYRFCDLCEAIHDSQRPAKHYSNVTNWFVSATNCALYPGEN